MSDPVVTDTYRCPECLRSLAFVNGALQCSACAAYPVVEGVPVFSRSRDAYYGEIPRSEMRRIVARANVVGWRDALLEHADETGSLEFCRYATGNIRSAFEFLLNVPSGTVLDYGCGPGAVSVALARHATALYATDLTYERVAFAKIRAAQEGLRNFHAFCGGDTNHIPFPDAFFDTIIVAGVLEWLPEFSTGKPSDIQLAFLKETKRVLKPDGLLFVAIENRIAFTYFRGTPEHHTRLRYISLMPRIAADLYSRLARGKPLRPYTYTKAQYRRLFRRAGFDWADFWGLLPNYRDIQVAADLSRPAMVRHALPVPASNLKKLRNAAATPLLPWLIDSFGIRVGRKAARRPFVDDLLAHISQQFLGGEVLTPTKYVTSTHAVHVWAEAGTKYVVHLPLSVADETRMDAGLTAAAEIRKIAPVPLTSFVARSSFKGIGFAVDVVSAGAPLRDIRSNQAEILNVLVLLHNHTRGVAAPWSEILRAAAERYTGALTRAAGLRAAAKQMIDVERLNRLIGYVTDIPGTGSTCAVHGDFWTNNILVDGGRITAILDWDRFDRSGLPHLDLFHLLTKHEQESLQGDHFGQAVINVHRNQLGSGLVQQYAQRLSVDLQLARRCMVLYWLQQTAILLTEDEPVSVASLRDAVEQPLEYFSAVAATTVAR